MVRWLGFVCSSVALVGCGLVLDLGSSPSVDVSANATSVDSGVGSVDASRADASRGDASPTDSGVPDGGGDTGMPDGGPARLGCTLQAGAIACEDFEGAPPTAPWQQLGAGTFTRVRSPSERGQYFGRFETAPGSQVVFRRTVTPLHNGDDLYMRAFIRVNANSAASWNVLMQAASEPMSAKMSLDFTGNAELNAVHSDSIYFSGQFPTQRWACIEGHFFLSSTAGRIDVSVDGGSIGERTELDTAVPPDGLATVFFGIVAEAGNTATLQVEYDDVVFSRSPVGGCD